MPYKHTKRIISFSLHWSLTTYREIEKKDGKWDREGWRDIQNRISVRFDDVCVCITHIYMSEFQDFEDKCVWQKLFLLVGSFFSFLSRLKLPKSSLCRFQSNRTCARLFIWNFGCASTFVCACLSLRFFFFTSNERKKMLTFWAFSFVFVYGAIRFLHVFYLSTAFGSMSWAAGQKKKKLTHRHTSMANDICRGIDDEQNATNLLPRRCWWCYMQYCTTHRTQKQMLCLSSRDSFSSIICCNL